jgi:tetratricopeptide (TPR) repeat protein
MEQAATQEERDAEKVRQAVAAIQEGKADVARRLLESVVANTLANYVHQFERDGKLVVKFWNMTEFVHFITRNKDTLKRDVIWQSNAYPQACYYLAFLAVKEGRFDEALQMLDRGERLEPNPHFELERAQAYLRGRPDFAKGRACYERVLARGEEVPGHLRAAAMRGLGFILIEEGDWDGAEQRFRDSLALDPQSSVANNELAYIVSLRAGGARAPSQAVATMDTAGVCELCSARIESGGRAGHIDGRVVYICDACIARHTRKWWQFWKWL